MKKEITILLVDDQEENLYSLENVLEKKGRTFLKAKSGNEALKLALNNEIGLIISDVQMPEMDGFEFVSLLKMNSKTKNINVVFATAFSRDNKSMIKGLKIGAIDYLYKPLNIGAVCAKVDLLEELYLNRKALIEKNAELDRLNQEMENFAYIVSHDLKAPLRAVSSLSQFMKEDIEDELWDELTEKLTLVHQRTEKMQNLIDGVLSYSRAKTAEATIDQVDIKQMVNGIIETLSLELPEEFTIINEVDSFSFKTDSVRLEQVISNILSNAIKYHDKADGYIKISMEKKDRFIVLAVEDNGPGIAKNDQSKIFEMFGTVHSRTDVDSTGVGLAIVKKIVQYIGGDIRLTSALGKGATFTVRWPISTTNNQQSDLG